MTALTVLFLDKVFLKRAPVSLRGVELFNLNLLRDLVRLGYPVTLIAESSWQAPVRAFFASHATPDMLWFTARGPDALATPLAGWKLRGRRYDRLLVGNVGNGLIPLLRRLGRTRAFARAVLVAHREAGPRFVNAWCDLPGCVVAVNQKIAGPFRDRGCAVAVDYGIFNSELFYPPAQLPGDPVRFIVLGALDNAWKGADTAQAAFAQLPSDLRARAELHLASFTQPPPVGERIVAHSWLPASEIPDLLRRMSVMACPSRDEEVMRETFSQAMVQGMLSGLPVLANDLPILTEKLDRGGGLVFRDPKQLADHMAALIRDSALRARLGREARSTALERYVWDTARFAARYLDPES